MMVCRTQIYRYLRSLKPHREGTLKELQQIRHIFYANKHILSCVKNQVGLITLSNLKGKSLKIAGIGLSVFLFGCSEGDMSDLNKYIAEVKARPKSAIEPLPEIKVVEPFLFNPEKLRDPFVAAIQNSQDAENLNGNNSGIKPDPLHQKEDLEHYPLDALRMVGTVRLDSVLWGLVKAEESTENAKEKSLGTIHRVKVGNYLGTNYGKILRIAEDKIELLEIVPDKPGTWREQEQELPLVLAE